MTRSACGRT